jgi:hypothetical protein
MFCYLTNGKEKTFTHDCHFQNVFVKMTWTRENKDFAVINFTAVLNAILLHLIIQSDFW